MSGYAGFLKLLDATTFKSLYANTAGGAPLWTVKSLSLPGFNGYITCLQVVFQNILVPLVLTSPWTLTTDQLPVEECLRYSVFLHASKMSSHRSWPLMSKASMPSISQRSSTVVFGILSFQEMSQIFRRHLRWNWSSFFT